MKLHEGPPKLLHISKNLFSFVIAVAAVVATVVVFAAVVVAVAVAVIFVILLFTLHIVVPFLGVIDELFWNWQLSTFLQIMGCQYSVKNTQRRCGVSETRI